jgi:hypothetical protein
MTNITREFFAPLSGHEFRSYRDLENEIVKRFNAQLEEFPPHYSYQQLIRWGQRQGVIEPTEYQGYRIEIGDIDGID